MNMNATRKYASLLLALLLIIGNISVVLADKSYIVSTYTLGGGRTSFSEGEEVTINLNLSKLKNLEGNENYTLINTSDSFVLSTGGSAYKIGSFGAAPGDAAKAISVPVRYTGKGKTFSFNIIKDSDGAVMTSDSVIIKEAVETSTVPPKPDTSKLLPKLVLANDDPLGPFSAGKQHEVSFTLSNIGLYQAKNISISLEKGEDVMPIVVSGSVLRGKIATIDASKTGDVTLKFAINPAVSPKTYLLQLKLTYENAYGDIIPSETIPVYMALENNSLEPMISLVGTKLENGPLDSKGPKILGLIFQNTGTLKASKITTQLVGFKSDGARLYEDTDTRLIGNMVQNMSGKVQYKIIAGKNAKGPIELEVVVKYFDDMGVSYEKKYPIFVDLAEEVLPINDTKGISVAFDKVTYQLNSKATKQILVTIKNNSATTKENLKLTITSDATLKFLSPYVQLVDTLKAGESKTFSYKAMLGSQVTPNTYPIYATLVHQKGAEGDQQMAVAGVFIEEEGAGGSKPKVIIESYNYGGEAALAGTVFDLVVRFSNTSDVMGIKNAKVVMTADEGVFIPVDAANSFFIERIGAGGTVEKVLRLKVKADAKVQMYGISFKIDYEDQNGKSYDEMKNPYTAEEKISLNVKQEVRLEISDVVLPPEIYVGSPVPVEVEFFNMGKSPMYNLMVKLEGDFQAQNSNYFVGNFESGRSEFFSGQIIPDKAGELKGQLRFIFEDETGVKQEKSVPVTVNVMEGGGMPGGEEFPPIDPGNGGEMPTPDDAAFKMPMWGWAVAIGLPLFIGSFIAIRVRRNRRLEELAAIADED